MINLFLNRIFRAIKIDIDLFEEVEKDKKATFQAGVVVVSWLVQAFFLFLVLILFKGI